MNDFSEILGIKTRTGAFCIEESWDYHMSILLGFLKNYKIFVIKKLNDGTNVEYILYFLILWKLSVHVP